jgi:hypothetical protein
VTGPSFRPRTRPSALRRKIASSPASLTPGPTVKASQWRVGIASNSGSPRRRSGHGGRRHPTQHARGGRDPASRRSRDKKRKSPTRGENAISAAGRWVAAITAVCSGGRSAANASRNFAGSIANSAAMPSPSGYWSGTSAVIRTLSLEVASTSPSTSPSPGANAATKTRPTTFSVSVASRDPAAGDAQRRNGPVRGSSLADDPVLGARRHGGSRHPTRRAGIHGPASGCPHREGQRVPSIDDLAPACRHRAHRQGGAGDELSRPPCGPWSKGSYRWITGGPAARPQLPSRKRRSVTSRLSQGARTLAVRPTAHRPCAEKD